MTVKLKILKIGGSVCTEKSKNITKIKTKQIQRIAKEIIQAKKKKKIKLIIVHGAGPFGHKLVKKYKIEKGLKNNKHKKGFVKTHESMELLNRKIVETLHKAGLLAFPVQTSAVVIQKNKKIKSFNTRIIEDLLKLDDEIIPVLYGDVVVDETLKGSVVSGDAIISYLAKKLKISEIIFGTDVNGVFDSDPKKNKKAIHFPVINSKNFLTILKKAKKSKSVDVTGGMKGKLLEIKKGFKGKHVLIFNMNKKNLTTAILLGKKIGTQIKL